MREREGLEIQRKEGQERERQGKETGEGGARETECSRGCQPERYDNPLNASCCFIRGEEARHTV